MERVGPLERSTPKLSSAPGLGAQVLGERARHLEARALARDPLTDRVSVGFVREALEPPEVERLAAVGELFGARGLTVLAAPGDSWRALHEESLTSDLHGLGALARVAGNALRPRPYPRVMGIVNVTPDSFSDGGSWLDPAAAVARGLKLAGEGADILDIGGESTRPGAPSVDAETELGRVLPVVEALVSEGVPVSIDTRKARVARAALAAGATMVNDVSAGQDPDMFGVVAEHGTEYCLMHMRGTPQDMQRSPRYVDCPREVTAFLRERAALAWKAGVAGSKLVLDPGIGFGKRLEDNVALIRTLPELRSLGAPVLLGVSRKSFLGQLGGEGRADRRDAETTAAVTSGSLLGADIHRVHDVDPIARALRVSHALCDDSGEGEPAW